MDFVVTVDDCLDEFEVEGPNRSAALREFVKRAIDEAFWFDISQDGVAVVCIESMTTAVTARVKITLDEDTLKSSFQILERIY